MSVLMLSTFLNILVSKTSVYSNNKDQNVPIQCKFKFFNVMSYLYQKIY